MLTEDFEIKIIDLGYGLALSGRSGKGFMKTKLGTSMYMAPEVHDKTVFYYGQDADCFALGVSMFISKARMYPWKKPDIDTDQSYKLLAGSNGLNANKFWANFEELDIDDDFKDLIEGMLTFDPTSRPTIGDILGHSWMRGPTCSLEEFKASC